MPRNKEKLITTDEARTPFNPGSGSNFHEQLVGLDIEVNGSYSDNEVRCVWIEPQSPTSHSVVGMNWALRAAVTEGGYADLYDDGGSVDDPLPYYEHETTEDYRDTNPENPHGDGSYVRDGTDSPLTEQIANISTRNGGRIPTEFRAHVQNEGYARSRKWIVYAPASNPYHIAASVTDLLRNAKGVSSVDVEVNTETGAKIARRLKTTGFGDAFDNNEEDDLLTRAIRELRWRSGLPRGPERSLTAARSEAGLRLAEYNFDSPLGGYEEEIRRAANHPGDAWSYCKVVIRADEEATDPVYR
jgi:hypothetical protein